jgi:hypothetical protein
MVGDLNFGMKLIGWALVVLFSMIVFNIYRWISTPPSDYPRRPQVIYECARALHDPAIPVDVKKECKKHPERNQVTR